MHDAPERVGADRRTPSRATLESFVFLPSPRRTRPVLAAADRRTARAVLRAAAAILISAAALLAPAQAQDPPATGQDAPIDVGSRLGYDELLLLADRSPSVTAARRSLEQAERQASARAMPLTFDGSAGYGRIAGEADPGGGAPIEDLAEGDVAPIVLGVRVDPFLVGSGADELARARASVERARTEVDAARRRARIDAVTAFQDALAAERALAIAAAEAELAQRELDAVRARREAGGASDLALAEAELAAARVAQARDAAARQAALAGRALAATLGRDVPAPEGPLPAPPSLPERSSLSPEDRGDLVNADAAIADADRTVDATIRDALPTVTLGASWLRGDDATTVRLGGSIDTASFAPSLRASYDPDDGVQGVLADDGSLDRFEITVSMDFVFSPALADALAAVRISRDQARAQREVVVRSAEIAIERAWLAALDAAERVELAEETVTLARRSAEVARLRVEAGAAAPAAAERAELDLRRAESDRIAATDAYRLALFRLLDAAAAPPEELE